MSQIEVDSSILKDPLARFGDAAATNFNPFTTDIDAVRGQETGYTTLNPLSGSFTLSEGNLKGVSSGAYGCQFSTIGATSGKWYAETTVLGTNIANACGIARFDHTDTYAGNGASNFAYAYLNDGRKATVGGTRSTYGSTWQTAGDTIGIAFDADNGTVRFYNNGADQGIAFSTIDTSNGLHYFVQFDDSNTGNSEQTWNFGQKPFKFPPPAGFQPVNAANVRPETVIARPDQFVQTTIWSGNDSNPRGISTPNLKPDLVWIKTRDAGYHHGLFDSVRGAGGAKRLYSDQTYAEGGTAGAEGTAYGELSAFNNGGFTVNTGTTSDIWVNNSGNTYVAWSWKAGGNKNTFNVDDVGYASASDVNMNVGALNSSAYDQTQTWSNALASSTGFRGSEPATNAFDGDTSSICSAVGSGTITFTSPVTFSSDSTIRVIVHGGDTTVSVNGGADQTISAGSLQTVTYSNSGNATFIMTFVRGGGADTGVRAVEIGGKLLVDNGVTPPNVPSIAATGASVGTKQGFSIIKYTGNQTDGATVSHGLGKIPHLIIVKSITDGTYEWGTLNVTPGTSTGFSGGNLNDNATVLDLSNGSRRAQSWHAAPTSSVFSLGVDGSSYTGTYNNNQAYIAYVWCDVPGLQKFGSYKGNNDDDGVFVELGFRPSIVVIKRADNTDDWFWYDGTRRPINVNSRYLRPNQSAVENPGDGSGTGLDLLSNGFKARSDSSAINNTETYVYAAWAEAPTVNLYGGQSNAR